MLKPCLTGIGHMVFLVRTTRDLVLAFSVGELSDAGLLGLAGMVIRGEIYDELA